MKICHFTSAHPRGDVRVFYKQCTYLAKNGHDVTLIVADGKGNEEKNGVKIIDIGNYRLNRFKRLTTAKKRIFQKAIEIQADIYQFHDPELLSVGKKLKKSGKKVVFDSHEDVPKQILYKTWLGPLRIRKIISKQYNKYEKKAVKKLDGLISVIDEITDKFECKRKVTLKNYPILETYNKFINSYDRKKKQFVYVGSLTHHRGIKDCIQAMRFISDEYRLVLIGGFASEEFKAQCEALPEWEKVVYKGFLPMEEVAPILGDSLVGLSVLHPEENYKMSLPTKGFEYMSAGTPIVLSDFDYWKPYFDGCGIFVQPESPKIIAEGMLEIIGNKSNYETIRKKCIDKAKTYSWETEVQKLIQLYEDVLS